MFASYTVRSSSCSSLVPAHPLCLIGASRSLRRTLALLPVDTPKPTLATLHEDDKGNRHLRTHELVVKDKMLAPGPWSQVWGCEPSSLAQPVWAHVRPECCPCAPLSHGLLLARATQIVLEATANKLLPLPSGGVIVLAEDSITYHDGSTYLSIPTSSSPSPTCFQAWGKVDPTSTRWLLGDQVMHASGHPHPQCIQRAVCIAGESLSSCLATPSLLAPPNSSPRGGVDQPHAFIRIG